MTLPSKRVQNKSHGSGWSRGRGCHTLFSGLHWMVQGALLANSVRFGKGRQLSPTGKPSQPQAGPSEMGIIGAPGGLPSGGTAQRLLLWPTGVQRNDTHPHFPARRSFLTQHRGAGRSGSSKSLLPGSWSHQKGRPGGAAETSDVCRVVSPATRHTRHQAHPAIPYPQCPLSP